MELSVILVNYRSPQLVIDCIDSIYRETRDLAFEIIVVDNDSRDNSENLVQRKFPSVRWVNMGYNSGFARANNAGMAIAKGRFLLILNTDTIILDDAIHQSIRLLDQAPGAVGCGVQLLNPDGSTQISGAHFVRGGLNTLLPLPYFGRLVRSLGYRLKTTVPSVQQVQQDIEVDWVVGAYILVKKTAVEQAGMMDPDFFMYAEEIEWCARLRKQGKLVLFAQPKVIHIGGGTSSDYYSTKAQDNENGKNLWNRKGRQIIVSTLLRIRKQFGAGWFLLVLGCYLAEVLIFPACLLFDKILNGKGAKYRWQNTVDYAVNMGVLLRYTGRILLNQPFFYKVA